MSHLPECPMAKLPKASLAYLSFSVEVAETVVVDWQCICEQLRACEQRVLLAAYTSVEALLAQGDCPECSFTTRDEEILAAIDAVDAPTRSQPPEISPSMYDPRTRDERP